MLVHADKPSQTFVQTKCKRDSERVNELVCRETPTGSTQSEANGFDGLTNTSAASYFASVKTLKEIRSLHKQIRRTHIQRTSPYKSFSTFCIFQLEELQHCFLGLRKIHKPFTHTHTHTRTHTHTHMTDARAFF